MLPILLIHGYSSEGSDNSVEAIYGTLPADLRAQFGAENVRELNLSRWISLSDGIDLDDVSFAMDRALKAQYPGLLDGKNGGFHVIIHSTGALVVRNWISRFSDKPSPVKNLVHLAGANFGSGLAHIGQGQLARWGRLIFQRTGAGTRVLDELEFGAWKTLDMHLGYLQPGRDMYRDYQVQEFCLIGSRTLDALRLLPIRYIKEDSADSTVRTSACNLNFNYIAVTPALDGSKITAADLAQSIETRLTDKPIGEFYQYSLDGLCANRPEVPFAVLYETAHFGDDIGIVSGADNRRDVLYLIAAALNTPYDPAAYQDAAKIFQEVHAGAFARAAGLASGILYNAQQQYEGHAQLIFRLKDQFGNAVEHFDITLNSQGRDADGNKLDVAPPGNKLEDMIEDKHSNDTDKGTLTFYLRTQQYDKDNKVWNEQLDKVVPVDVEITGHEPSSDDIGYLPVNIRLEPAGINKIIQSFRTTLIDITLLRLPSDHVFEIKRAAPPAA